MYENTRVYNGAICPPAFSRNSEQIREYFEDILRICYINHLIGWKLIKELILFTAWFVISDKVASIKAPNWINYSIRPLKLSKKLSHW